MSASDANIPSEIAVLRQQAGIIDAVLRTNLEGISHSESLITPRPAGNCLNWIVGHLVHGYEQALPHLGQERVLAPGALERYARGSAPLEGPEDAWDIGELLSAWAQGARRFDEGLGALTSDDLKRSQDFFGRGAQRTLRAYLSFVMFHQAYHAGQTGVVRRVVGKAGAIP